MNRKEEKILERIDWIWKQLGISLILFVLGIMLLGWLISSQRGANSWMAYRMNGRGICFLDQYLADYT